MDPTTTLKWSCGPCWRWPTHNLLECLFLLVLNYLFSRNCHTLTFLKIPTKKGRASSVFLKRRNLFMFNIFILYWKFFPHKSEINKYHIITTMNDYFYIFTQLWTLSLSLKSTKKKKKKESCKLIVSEKTSFHS